MVPRTRPFHSRGNIEFITKLNELTGEEKGVIHLQAGAEHGFDNDASVVGLNVTWVRKILDSIEDVWLKQG